MVLEQIRWYSRSTRCEGDSGNNGTIAVSSGATVLAAKTADDDFTVATITTNMAANTLDNFVLGL